MLFIPTASYAEKSENWIKVSTDEYGETFINSNNVKRLDTQPDIVEYGYKYIYRYGVPSLQITPRGYIQAIHQINCLEKTRAIAKSQRFKPSGKAIDKDVPFGTIYFEPIHDSFTDLNKVYNYVCTAKK